jgi:hypothetical protein
MCKLCYAPVHWNNEDLHLALFKLQYTVLQYRTAELKFSLRTLYYVLLQCSSVDLRFELYKLSYTLFQWSIYDMQFGVSHYTICFCCTQLVTFSVNCASCVMSWSINNFQIALWKLHYVPLIWITLKFQEKIYIFSLSSYTWFYTFSDTAATHKTYWRIFLVTRATVCRIFQEDQAECYYE